MLGPRKSFYRPLRRDESDGDHEWLLTFADAMTLLLAFFIMLVSFSKVDMLTFEQVKAGIARDLGQRSITRPAAQLRAELDTLVDSLGVADAVRIDTFERGIVLELAANAFYQPGAATLRPEARPILESVAETLRTPVYSKFKIAVEGHTDDNPITNARFASNWELSAARATNVVRLFGGAEIPVHRMRAVAFAETQPKVPNRDGAGNPLPENQAKNRRIIIRVHR
ncbi:MAG: flagellar motor protein MotB [Rhodospirillaceae bacterium]|jgi:chemotaxis protein MotB|nr:flagellar motor protein MotB [Rhodospirillaceae bacterium]MBT5945500.1 flagellar motor protein MotB [Rhodospirillaceae bacterium]MBT6404230.1 flagellar motor protein MotB [Rhodospirillaceae bacterium]MBT6535125.1 flagellar motor protein MotB [Rhodospirillaceae bacterium]MBT7360731.1 flagellar motor protein MotB [Rhodospirillaceae bacterium]